MTMKTLSSLTRRLITRSLLLGAVVMLGHGGLESQAMVTAEEVSPLKAQVQMEEITLRPFHIHVNLD